MTVSKYIGRRVYVTEANYHWDGVLKEVGFDEELRKGFLRFSDVRVVFESGDEGSPDYVCTMKLPDDVFCFEPICLFPWKDGLEKKRA